MPTLFKLNVAKKEKKDINWFISKVNATGSKYFTFANMEFAGDKISNLKVTKVTLYEGEVLYKLERIKPITWCNATFLPEPTWFESDFKTQVHGVTDE